MNMTAGQYHDRVGVDGWRPSVRQKIRRSLLLVFFLLFPITMNYYSFMLPVMGLLEGVICGALLFWGLFFFSSLLVGRSGCGYICPLGGLQDMWDGALTMRLRRLNPLFLSKYLLSVVWLVVLTWAFFRGEKPFSLQFFYLTEHIVSWDSVYGFFPYAIVLGLVSVSALLLGRRGFCRYFCWYALLNIGGTALARTVRLPHLALHADSSKCAACHQCTANCPMSLPVYQMVQSGRTFQRECILCGTCIDGCSGKVLSYRWDGVQAEEAKRETVQT